MGKPVLDYLGFDSIPAASIKVTTEDGNKNSSIGEHNVNNKLDGRGIFICYRSGIISIGHFDNGRLAAGNYI